MMEFKCHFFIADCGEYAHVVVDWDSPCGPLYSDHQTSDLSKEELVLCATKGVLDMFALVYGEGSKENEAGWKSVYNANQRKIYRTINEQVDDFLENE